MRVTDKCPNCGAPIGDSTQCRYCGKVFQSAATEQTEFQVILTAAPKNKMLGVIRVVWEINGRGRHGLVEAKDLVEHAPRPVKQGVSRKEAEDIIEKLKKAGAEAEIR
jgi:large subunit ribosomal protein L7/L12